MRDGDGGGDIKEWERDRSREREIKVVAWR